MQKYGIDDFFNQLKSDIEALGTETQFRDGVIRTLISNLGVNEAAAILEADIESIKNGNAAPYRVVRFHITLAKDIREDLFSDVTFSLNQLNNVIAGGDYPSFGCFGLHMPLRQIFLNYSIPINTDVLEAELENVRFFLGTVYEQLDVFIDLVLFIAEGHKGINFEEYLHYLEKIRDVKDIEERVKLLSEYVAAMDNPSDV